MLYNVSMSLKTVRPIEAPARQQRLLEANHLVPVVRELRVAPARHPLDADPDGPAVPRKGAVARVPNARRDEHRRLPMKVLTFFLTFCQFLANYERLVLGCIVSYDSDQRLILQGFLRSTRFTNLCTSPNSKIQLNFVRHFRISTNFIFKISAIFHNSSSKLANFDEFSPEFQQFSWRRSKSPRFSNFLRFRTENN